MGDKTSGGFALAAFMAVITMIAAFSNPSVYAAQEDFTITDKLGTLLIDSTSEAASVTSGIVFDESIRNAINYTMNFLRQMLAP